MQNIVITLRKRNEMIKLIDIYNYYNGDVYIEKGGQFVPLTEGYCKEYDLHV